MDKILFIGNKYINYLIFLLKKSLKKYLGRNLKLTTQKSFELLFSHRMLRSTILKSHSVSGFFSAYSADFRGSNISKVIHYNRFKNVIIVLWRKVKRRHGVY